MKFYIIHRNVSQLLKKKTYMQNTQLEFTNNIFEKKII